MNAHVEGVATKRRKVRKGTHSCWECKRRKVKCTFAASDDAVCITCRERGKKCVSQEVPDGQIDLASNVQRTGKHDVPYHQLLSTLPPTSTSENSLLEYVGHDRDSSNANQQQDLPVTPQSLPTPLSRHVPAADLSRLTRISQAFLDVLPCERDITILLGRISRISLLCYQSNYKSVNLLEKQMPKEQIPLKSLLYPDSHPVLFGRQMLLFATALQHIPPKEVISGLTENHYSIMERLAESAIEKVTTNDVLLGTLESLENLILEALYHIDGGNIRRAWITLRRAVMAAQLLGLHRPGQYRFKIIDAKNDLDPEVMWASISSMECNLSLLLGLPSSFVATSRPGKQAMCAPEQNNNFPTLGKDLAIKIMGRNETHIQEQALQMTQEIDRELLKITKQMSPMFWRPSTFVGFENDSEAVFWEMRRTWDLMCYFTSVNQLHLPYMLYSSHVSQGIYSRLACANASREVLNREIALHPIRSVTACCRMSEFLALIAGMTLILAHIVSHRQKDVENLLSHQRLGDRAIVQRALECMESMTRTCEDVLAAKCVKLLMHLLEAEENAAQEAQDQAHKLPGVGEDCEHNRNVLIIKVPYIGDIRIARQGVTSAPPNRVSQDQGSHEEITIGGMGSLHVNNASLVEHDDRQGTSDSTAPQAAIVQMIDTSSAEENATHYSQNSTENIFAQQGHMFPDAAASMSDWVFQGFDTAFFDVLMRGAGDHQDHQEHSPSAEAWNFGAFE